MLTNHHDAALICMRYDIKWNCHSVLQVGLMWLSAGSRHCTRISITLNQAKLTNSEH